MTESIPLWQQKLADRGILQGALECGVHATGKTPSYWQYPCRDEHGGQPYHRNGIPAVRQKALDSGAKLKYLWGVSRPDDDLPWFQPQYYFPPGFLQAVADAEGDCILASGEPDVWTWVQMGTRNVFCWFGEKNVPDSLPDDLKAWGVDMLYLYPDRDRVGNTSAAKVHRLLAGKVPHVVSILPDVLGEAGDVNKAWLHAGCKVGEMGSLMARCHIVPLKTPMDFDASLAELRHAAEGSAEKAYDLAGDPVRFWQALVHSEQYPQTQAAKREGTALRNDSPLEMPVDYYLAIQQALDPAMEFGADGWSRKAFQCPSRQHAHDPNTPAAHWHRDKHILKCFKCGPVVLAKTVAEQLGIDYKLYLPTPARQGASAAQSGQAEAVPGAAPARRTFVRQRDLRKEDGSTYVPMPYNEIGKHGGMARRMMRGKCTGIGAPSGNNKTTLMECVIGRSRRNGYHVGLWSPEWSAEEFMMREIQRQGGPTFDQQVDDAAYHIEIAQGVPHDVLIAEGKIPLSQEDLELADRLRDRINGWPGQLYYIEPGPWAEVKQALVDVQHQSIKDGTPISLFGVDYIQLAGIGYEAVIQAAWDFKQHCMTVDIHGLVTSQMRKDESGAASRGEKLKATGMEYLTENFFNLLLLVQRDRSEFDNSELDSLTVALAKNSTGRKGVVTMPLDPKRLLITDPAPKDTSLLRV